MTAPAAAADTLKAYLTGSTRRAAIAALHPAWKVWLDRIAADAAQIAKAPAEIAVEAAETCDDPTALAAYRAADRRKTVLAAIDSNPAYGTQPAEPRQSKKLRTMLDTEFDTVVAEIAAGRHTFHMALQWAVNVDDSRRDDALAAVWNYDTANTRSEWSNMRMYADTIETALHHGRTDLAIEFYKSTGDQLGAYLGAEITNRWDTPIDVTALRWAEACNRGIELAHRADDSSLHVTHDAGRYATTSDDPHIWWAAVATDQVTAEQVRERAAHADRNDIAAWAEYARRCDVFEAAVETLAAYNAERRWHRTSQRHLGLLLARWPEASADARRAVAGLISADDLTSWIADTWVVRLNNDDEAVDLLAAVHAQGNMQLYTEALTRLTIPVDTKLPDAARRAKIARQIVARTGRAVDMLITGKHSEHVAWNAVQYLSDTIGDNADHWLCLWSMLGEWDGTLAELVEVTSLVSDDTADTATVAAA